MTRGGIYARFMEHKMTKAKANRLPELAAALSDTNEALKRLNESLLPLAGKIVQFFDAYQVMLANELARIRTKPRA